MRQLFDDADLRRLEVHFSYHELSEQAELVAQGKLDLAAFVMEEDAELLHAIMRQQRLDIVALDNLKGLIARYPWLSLGTITAGRYDLVRPTPAVDKPVANLATLVVAGPCARRADRIAFLVLLTAELPGFVRSNPPSATSSATAVPLAPETSQFFQNGQPALADQYFPWLVNILSPAYWVYLLMAVTLLFNAIRGFSRFRLWRIDSAREKVDARVGQLTGPGLVNPDHSNLGAARSPIPRFDLPRAVISSCRRARSDLWPCSYHSRAASRPTGAGRPASTCPRTRWARASMRCRSMRGWTSTSARGRKTRSEPATGSWSGP